MPSAEEFKTKTRKNIPEFVLLLDKTSRVQQFNDWLLSNKKHGEKMFKVKVKPSRTYSNVCAPIAGVIEHYRKLGLNIHVDYPKEEYVRHTRFWSPIAIENCAESEKYFPFDKVWTFETSEGVNSLVSAFVLELRKSDIIEEGVLTSIEWCMNETMDNVLQHSGTGKGYVMVQIHKQSKVFAFCVFDSGMGMYNSLKDTKHHPEKPIDAITLALQERITRDDKIGQGNGLWGLSSIVSEANGMMEISSGGAKYMFHAGKISTVKERGFVLNTRKGTTYLDVRINYDKKINISNALGGHMPSDFWLENIEDEMGNFVLKVSEEASGTGTRQSAAKLRTMAINIAHSEQKIVIFDFEGVNLISSSFADELIGKIIAEKGFLYFINAFRIKNLTSTNATILNRSVEQRMAQKYYIGYMFPGIMDEQDQ